jgi:hypothetical protein
MSLTSPHARQRRDLAIAAAHAAGLSLRDLAELHGLAPSRVHQIVRSVGEGYRDVARFASATAERPAEIPRWLASLQPANREPEN